MWLGYGVPGAVVQASSYSSNLTPSLGTFIAVGAALKSKKQNKNKNKQIILIRWAWALIGPHEAMDLRFGQYSMTYKQNSPPITLGIILLCKGSNMTISLHHGTLRGNAQGPTGT